MDSNNLTLFQFDYNFYITTYTDLDCNEYNTKEKCLAHYLRWGKNEGRCSSKEEMIYKYSLHLKESIAKNDGFIHIKDKFFNILIRTSNRPTYFQKCINSVLKQNYTNFMIHVCYDDVKSVEYLKQYENDSRINIFPVSEQSQKKYKFNLYCNSLLKQVETGYILFLDDDNYFLSHRVLEMINWYSGDNKIITWKFLRPDRYILKKDLYSPLILGEIDTSNVCFCSSLKDKSKWNDQQYGDYHFFKPLFDICNNSEKCFFDYTLTATQFNDKIGNFGEN